MCGSGGGQGRGGGGGSGSKEMGTMEKVASALSVPILSALLGRAVTLFFLTGYLHHKRADIAHVPPSAVATAPDLPNQVRPAHVQILPSAARRGPPHRAVPSGGRHLRAAARGTVRPHSPGDAGCALLRPRHAHHAVLRARHRRRRPRGRRPLPLPRRGRAASGHGRPQRQPPPQVLHLLRRSPGWRPPCRRLRRNRLLFCILKICKEILSYLPKVVGIDIVEVALWAKENTVTLDNQENNKEGKETSVATQTERKVTAKVTVENDLVSQAKDEEEDMETLLDTYVMGIGEADAFSERLKLELVALEVANVYQLVESEPLIEEEKASYFTNAEKLKVGYTSRTWIRRATSGEGVRSRWNSTIID